MSLNNQANLSQPQPEEFSFNHVKYKVEEFLGSGLTSDVYAASVSVIDIEKPATVKKIAIKGVKNCYKGEFNTEVQCLDALDHPNIIKMVGCQFPTESDDRQLLALEYCQYELFDIITEIGGFTEDIGRYFFFQQLLPAVCYMHIQGWCHRDLKLDNLFIGDDFKVRIADFTFAAPLNDPITGEPNTFEKQCGTVLYMAPEIQRGKKYTGVPADVWSLGVVLFMMVMGQNPFPTIDFYKMLWKKPKQFWSQFGKDPSSQFKQLVERMLSYNPEKRITIEEIRKHDWCQMMIPNDHFIKGCFNQETSSQ